MKLLSTTLLLLSFPVFLLAQQMEAVWGALEAGNRKEARLALEKSMKNPAARQEAALTMALLNRLESRSGSLNYTQEVFEAMENPSPYLYAFWSIEGGANGYNKHSKTLVQFLTKMHSSPKIHPSMRASLSYLLGVHHMLSHDFKSTEKSWSEIHSLTDWQFTGPFDNASGSGFTKAYPPITSPTEEATFKSTTNADIRWFTPTILPGNDAWVATDYFIPETVGVVYAQTFLESPDDRDVVIALGGSGEFKLWVNDVLAIEQEEERATDMDLYKRQVKLKKGVNRLLIQLGFTAITEQPNFIVRILDNQLEPLRNLKSSSSYRPYQQGSEQDLGELIPHYAETYFKSKLEQDPENILNYLLLSLCHQRRGQYNESLEILRIAEKLSPNNLLIQLELLTSFQAMDNRTEVLRQFERIRSLDDQLAMIVTYDLENSLNNEDYELAAQLIEQLGQFIPRDSEDLLNYTIRYQAARNDYNALIATINEAYAKYPDNAEFTRLQYYILKNTSDDPRAPIQVLQKYLKTNYNSNIYELLIEDFLKQGNKSEALNLMNKQLELFPATLDFTNDLLNYYYKQENYGQALAFVNRKLDNTPFNSGAWLDRGYVNAAMGNTDQAIEDFQTALHFNPNLFDAREKIRELQNKETIISFFKKEDMYDEIRKALSSPSDSDSNFEYIFYEKNMAVFQEGASVEYTLMAAKMLNEQGVESWKESSISFNSLRQRLIIEKAEVIKANGQKVQAERSGANIVFTSLEPGDAILIVYKRQNYSGGRLSKEFWDTEVFNSFVPIQQSRYRLLIPADTELQIHTSNVHQEPKRTRKEEFMLYEWHYQQLDKCKDEPLMPSLVESGMSAQVSTLKSWKTIAEWYRDLAMPLGREDYQVQKAYNAIFADKTFDSEFEKARAIYEYLAQNLRYSSVSFRQSGYIPQRPRTTLSTQLGDCKDFSLLYHTLAKKAGLSTRLVLVNTRTDNGENALQVPNIGFNHCIVQIELPDQILFQELTDPRLPFGAIPNSLANAQALIIPVSEDDPEGEDLIRIPYEPIHQTKYYRTTRIQIDDEDFVVNTKLEVHGVAASVYRHNFLGLNEERTKESVESMIRRPFKNSAVLKSYRFDRLDSREQSLFYEADFIVENERMKIGGMKVASIPFFEIIFTLDQFPANARQHPLLYWQYEDADLYETTIYYELPEGSEIVELPDDFQLNNEFINYRLSSEQISDNQIKVTRTVQTKRQNIQPEQYDAFRETVKKVVAAEDQYIVYR